MKRWIKCQMYFFPCKNWLSELRRKRKVSSTTKKQLKQNRKLVRSTDEKKCHQLLYSFLPLTCTVKSTVVVVRIEKETYILWYNLSNWCSHAACWQHSRCGGTWKIQEAERASSEKKRKTDLEKNSVKK